MFWKHDTKKKKYDFFKCENYKRQLNVNCNKFCTV